MAVADSAVVLPVEAALREVGDMSNATRLLTSSDRERVSNRIATLERSTDAEVVCAVATESGRYDRAESLCGLFVGLVALISGNKIAGMGGWNAAASLSVGSQAGLMVVGFVAGSVLASYWHGLRRLLVDTNELQSEVKRSVHQVFSQYGVGGTRHRGGLLIYLSLFERHLEVRCDQALVEKIPQADLDAIRDAVLAKVRTGHVAEGLLAGLDRAEEVLARVFPATDSTTSTLANNLLVFHPRP